MQLHATFSYLVTKARVPDLLNLGSIILSPVEAGDNKLD